MVPAARTRDALAGPAPGGRHVTALLLLLLLAVGGTPALAQQPPAYSERVEVTRLLLDARVLDDRGQPVRGLTASDFIVKVGSKVARVESAVWVGPGASVDSSPAETTVEAEMDAPAPEGRLIVFLFQKSLEPSRIVGFMRMLTEARGVLDSLSPIDRVAVLSFDSSLHVWVDFTNDYARVRRIFEDGILFERAGPVQEARGVSLVRLLAPQEARRTYTIERALRRIGNALADVPGAKSVVLVGHGFGRFGATGVTMENEYEPMREALQRARAAVFSLDVTTADYHSLEAGLQLVAEQTGGFFARTHIFTTRAVRTLLGALAGHYTLFVELPALDEGAHRTDIELAGKKGTVLARSTYIVRTTRVERVTDSSCHVTRPDASFVPPSPYPGRTPLENEVWFGTPALWTMLPASGTWRQLPVADAGYRQKVFLWYPGYDGRAEQWPNATVTGRRADAEAEPIRAERATNAYRRDFGGWAMLVDIEIPSAGCWEITAAYNDASLEFTVQVVP
jgi:VWFA-related protein